MEQGLEQFLQEAGYPNLLVNFVEQGITTLAEARQLTVEGLIQELGCKGLVAKKLHAKLHGVKNPQVSLVLYAPHLQNESKPTSQKQNTQTKPHTYHQPQQNTYAPPPSFASFFPTLTDSEFQLLMEVERMDIYRSWNISNTATSAEISTRYKKLQHKVSCFF